MSQQNPTIPTATAAKGIDSTIVDLQTHLSFELSWLTNGMGRSYRLKTVRSNGEVQFLPMVYLGTSKYNYFDASMDNDKEGQSIILVGDGTYPDFQRGFYGIIEYPVSLIFSANLDTINSTLLETEVFTEHLMEDVRQALIRGLLGKPYQLTIDSETIDFDTVYSEFDINTDAGKTNKPLAPMTYFRFDLTVQIKETCPPGSLDRCTAIQQNLTQDDIDNCIIPTYCAAPVLYENSYSMDFDGTNENVGISYNAAFDFERTDPFSFSIRFKYETAVELMILMAKQQTGAPFRGYAFSFDPATQKFQMSLKSTVTTNEVRVDSVAQSLIIGTVYQIAFTYDGSSSASGVKMYLDSAPIGTTTAVDNLSATTKSNISLFFAQFSTIVTQTQLNTGRLWNVALTPAQVITDYNGGTPDFPILPLNLIFDCGFGDYSLYSADISRWVIAGIDDTDSFQSANMNYANRIAAI
jgi:hypothetical protein